MTETPPTVEDYLAERESLVEAMREALRYHSEQAPDFHVVLVLTSIADGRHTSTLHDYAHDDGSPNVGEAVDALAAGALFLMRDQGGTPVEAFRFPDDPTPETAHLGPRAQRRAFAEFTGALRREARVQLVRAGLEAYGEARRRKKQRDAADILAAFIEGDELLLRTAVKRIRKG